MKKLLSQTPLHLAAVSPHGGICLEVLLNEGAEVQVQCKEGRTPLHMIALQGQFTRASSVIEHGEFFVRNTIGMGQWTFWTRLIEFVLWVVCMRQWKTYSGRTVVSLNMSSVGLEPHKLSFSIKKFTIVRKWI